MYKVLITTVLKEYGPMLGGSRYPLTVAAVATSIVEFETEEAAEKCIALIMVGSEQRTSTRTARCAEKLW